MLSTVLSTYWIVNSELINSKLKAGKLGTNLECDNLFFSIDCAAEIFWVNRYLVSYLYIFAKNCVSLCYGARKMYLSIK